LHYSRQPHTLLRLALLILLCTSASITSIVIQPSASAAPLGSVQSHSVALNAGSTATLDVRGLALQPGSTISGDRLVIATTPLTAERVRTTLFYAIDWGYTDSAPEQVALAVWYAQDGNWRAPEHAIAERIASAAASSQGSPSWRPEGRSLLSLVDGQVTVQELSLTPLAASPALGRGKLTITNTSSQDLMVYLPYGTTFSGQSGDVLVWATAPDETEVEPPSGATPSPTSPATEPPPVEESATPSYKSGTTPVAETTPSYKAVRPSPTPVQGANLPPVAAESVEVPEKVQDEQAPEPTNTSAPAPESNSNIRSKPQPVAPVIPVENATKREEAASTVGGDAPPPPVDDPVQPASIVAGPPPELPKAQPTTRSDIPVPTPVGTEVADEIPVPVPTGEADNPGQVVPPAQQTRIAPIETAPAKVTEVVKPTSTPEPKEVEDNTGAGNIDARSGSDGSAESKPTPEPAPVVPPVVVDSPPVPVKSSDSGVTPSQLPVASPPSSAPATGGGPSSTGTWLALCAALLLVSGVQMRRMSAPKTVMASPEQR
jgi:hypothetical protein